jgi:hypothetical protein
MRGEDVMVPEKHKDGKRRYGTWAGNPQGRTEDPWKCVEQVYTSHTRIPHQCSRHRGHGLDGEFCKQHAKRYPAKQDDGSKG